jgi:hypothetical protein
MALSILCQGGGTVGWEITCGKKEIHNIPDVDCAKLL